MRPIRSRFPGWLRGLAAPLLIAAAALPASAQPGSAPPSSGGAGPQATAVAAARAAPPPRPSAAASTGAPAPPSSAAPAASANPADPPAEAAPDPRLVAARTLEERLAALSEGRLEVTIEPRALFDVDLADEEAIEVEVRRLQAIVDGPEPSPPPARGAPAAEPPPVDALFGARVAVDRARLAFLRRSADERRALLEDHAARKAAAEAEQPALIAQREAQERAQRDAAEAAAARQRALEEMEAARTEALRAVAKERARLLSVREAQSKFEASLLRREEQLAARAEQVLALRRRVEELLAGGGGAQRAAEASALYDELRSVLRQSRAELSAALTELRQDVTGVPAPPVDELGDLVVDRTELDRLRGEIRHHAEELAAREREARWARARAFHETITALNRDRHALYPWLPPERREALTGFEAAGRDQAAGEIDQVRVVVAYHGAATARFLASASRGAIADFVLSAAGFKLLGLLVLYLWWRRAAARWLAAWTVREVPHAAGPLGSRLETAKERLVMVALRVHRPLAALIALRLALGVLDPRIAGLLEVRIAWSVASWLLGGVVVVHTIDGLLARRGWAGAPPTATPIVRLRSLRLIGRVAVGFGLVLDVSDAVVGQGTLSAWLVQALWVPLIPVTLLLIRWWHPIILERTRARAAKSDVAAWVAAHPSGALGFVAAAVGGVYLIGVGIARIARAQMATFDATRRVLAYLFRREVSRAGKDRRVLRPLDPALCVPFDPDAPADRTVEAHASEIVRIEAAIEAPSGGVFAVVGERGSGKSTLTRQLAVDRPGSVIVRCPPGGLSGLRPRLLAALGMPEEATDDAIIAALRAETGPTAVVIDDAQRVVVPAVGGLAELDTLLALARASSARCTWVFCFGAVMWQFVECARGVRPLFDDVLRMRPWTEEQIGALIRERTAAAGITPSFRELLDDRVVDESERAELAARTEANFYRVLWDVSGGNPGIALHVWRDTLGVDDEGDVLVTLPSGPDTRELQGLPPDVVFVLRAVLRLERVALADVAASTMIAPRVVHDAIHYAAARGYVEAREGRYRVTWAWLRGVTTYLQRRHLLS